MPLTRLETQLIPRLLAYLRPHRRESVYVAIGVALTGAATLAQPIVLKIAIDDFIANQRVDGVSTLALAYGLILVLGYAAEALQTWSLQLLGQHVMFDMRAEIYRHLHRLDISYHDRHPVGETMARVVSDVDAMNEVFTSGVATICTDFVTVVGIVGLMLWLDWRAALVAMSVLPVVAVATLWYERRIRQSSTQVRLVTAEMSGFLQEKIAGVVDLQLFRREALMEERFAVVNRRQRDANVIALFYYASFSTAVEIVGAFSLTLIIWYGGHRVLEGTLTLGVLIAFVQYTLRLFRPISEMAEKLNVLQSATASVMRVFAFLDQPVAVESPARPQVPAVFRGHVVFEHVWFAYPGATDESGEPVWALKDVSFEIPAGGRLAIVGASGSGKTSILNLLLRFYDAQRGRIMLDGIDLRDYDLSTLRSRCGVVLQDPCLQSGSIDDNIRFGRPAITGEEVRRAADAADLSTFIRQLPQGYATVVGEGASTLSLGQKQQLAVARALAGAPRLILLDEATSNIDAWTEARIRHTLAMLSQEQTVVIVAHRFSAIQDVENILVLHKGVVRELGRHDELMARQGIYAQLFELQTAQGNGPARIRTEWPVA